MATIEQNAQSLQRISHMLENKASRETATREKAGLMSPADKQKLDGLGNETGNGFVPILRVECTTETTISVSNGNVTYSDTASVTGTILDFPLPAYGNYTITSIYGEENVSTQTAEISACRIYEYTDKGRKPLITEADIASIFNGTYKLSTAR